ncbi:MAG: 4-(cytidine 5'-diphospho)-2-C-methyl-D-erythritol kinase [Planctomycetota bacterium]|nr:4-(cytidine 5'-diphospho)-2-C-methyl-D-erythritol kinase [Planctomycetota bacterium]
MPDAVVVEAPAKLNLYLRILGKRADGFHELESVMTTIGLYDTLRFTANDSGSLELECHDAGRPVGGAGSPPESPPNGPTNLIWRAAQLLRDATGCAAGAKIELWKRIPIAAGLAGGSSDAAATLFGLNRLWKLNASSQLLHDLASQLGSDIPFFLCGATTALCQGRGEIITPLSLPAGLSVVVARPATGLSTAEVFRHCRPEPGTGGGQQLAAALSTGRLQAAAGHMHNTLQEAAFRLNADVLQLRDAFSQLPFVGHLMSGSGTSYFGLCHNRNEAARLAGRLRALGVGAVFVAQTRP